MFDFEKLSVYQKAKDFDRFVVYSICSDLTIDRVIINQLKRASLSIPLNIAEGSSRYTKADRKRFYIIARGSAFECVAVFDVLRNRNNIDEITYSSIYEKLEELSRMLYAMIQKYS